MIKTISVSAWAIRSYQREGTVGTSNLIIFLFARIKTKNDNK